jgi:hypothetical protein
MGLFGAIINTFKHYDTSKLKSMVNVRTVYIYSMLNPFGHIHTVGTLAFLFLHAYADARKKYILRCNYHYGRCFYGI